MPIHRNGPQVPWRFEDDACHASIEGLIVGMLQLRHRCAYRVQTGGSCTSEACNRFEKRRRNGSSTSGLRGSVIELLVCRRLEVIKEQLRKDILFVEARGKGLETSKQSLRSMHPGIDEEAMDR